MGTWSACGQAFCLGTTNLDVGNATTLAARASADFDGDGAVESNADEFAGLVGKHVTLQVVHNAGGLVVYVIDGKGFRNADGSFTRSAAPSLVSASTTP